MHFDKSALSLTQQISQLKARGLVIDNEPTAFLERLASDEQKQAGLDLADYLLQQRPTVTTIAEQLASPDAILKPDEWQLERLAVEPCDYYPAEWDK